MTMPDPIIEAYYDVSLRAPTDARRVGWSDVPTQTVRLRAMVDALTLSGRPLTRETRILDAGCGLGALYAHLLERLRHRPAYVGIDVHPEMVRRCRARWPTADFRQADVEAPPNGAFDLTVCCGSLNVRGADDAKPWRVIDALWRATSGTGVLALACLSVEGPFAPGYDTQFWRVDPVELRAQLRCLSPKIVLREDVLPSDVVAYVYH